VCRDFELFCAATKKLRITADDEIVELYVDGVLTSFSAGGWQTVRTVEIGDNTEVIAVKARDIAKVSDASCSQRKGPTAAVV
jgi:hypothetical protein